jgi:hypothetical protein
MEIIEVARLAARLLASCVRDDDVNLQANELGREVEQPVVFPFGLAVLDDEVPLFQVSTFAQTPPSTLGAATAAIPQ